MDYPLNHPRCVFQLLKKHYSRYSPKLVSKVTGTHESDLLTVYRAFAATGARGQAGVRSCTPCRTRMAPCAMTASIPSSCANTATARSSAPGWRTAPFPSTTNPFYAPLELVARSIWTSWPLNRCFSGGMVLRRHLNFCCCPDGSIPPKRHPYPKRVPHRFVPPTSAPQPA